MTAQRRCWLGIDLGTSSVRALMVDDAGAVVAMAGRRYPIDAPRPGWAEQDPELWWELAAAAVRETIATAGPDLSIGAVGVTGQMHGLVCLGAHGDPVRPAIVWPDRRAVDELDRLARVLPVDAVHRISGMAPATGQFGPDLAWLVAHEPEAVAATRHALLPKDFLRYRLTGAVATDPGDACGTLVYDLGAGRWSADLVTALGIPLRVLPEVRRSTAVAGTISADAAAQTGIPAGTPVVVGTGDQAAAAVALGIEEIGDTSVAISSGGTVVQVTDRPGHPAGRGLHVLCSAHPDRWLLMGASLNAGLVMAWWAGVLAPGRAEAIDELIVGAATVDPGAGGLLFLPYLAGERTPHLDPKARGIFLGLTREHGPAELTRAVLEGVGFALADCLTTVAAAGIRPEALTVSGGGTRNPRWRRVLCDVLGLPLRVNEHGEHSAIGAAMLAAGSVGGVQIPPGHTSEVVHPDPAVRELYDDRYALFAEAYRANRDLMARLGTV